MHTQNIYLFIERIASKMPCDLDLDAANDGWLKSLYGAEITCRHMQQTEIADEFLNAIIAVRNHLDEVDKSQSRKRWRPRWTELL